MELSPSEFTDVKRMIAEIVAAKIIDALDVEDLITIDISTAAQALGIGVTRAAQLLPIIEVGPRTRRVGLKEFKAFKQSNTTRFKRFRTRG